MNKIKMKQYYCKDMQVFKNDYWQDLKWIKK